MTRAGVDPGPLDEVTWWQTHDRWVWTSTPSRSTCVSRPAALASRRRTSASGPHDDTASNSTRRTDVQIVHAHPHRATRARAPDHAPTRSRAGDVHFMHPAARARPTPSTSSSTCRESGRRRRPERTRWAMNGVITLRDYGLVPLMFAERGVRKRGRTSAESVPVSHGPAGILAGERLGEHDELLPIHIGTPSSRATASPSVATGTASANRREIETMGPIRVTCRAGSARSWCKRGGGVSTSLWLRSDGCARERGGDVHRCPGVCGARLGRGRNARR